MADAKAQAHGIVAEARQLAEKERAVAMEKTKQEQEELLARARREIAAERDRAVADLRREAVDLSLAAASKLVGKRLDSETDRQDRERLPRHAGRRRGEIGDDRPQLRRGAVRPRRAERADRRGTRS